MCPSPCVLSFFGMLKNIVTSRSVKTSLPRPRPNQNKQLKLLYPVKDKMAKMCQREQTHMFLLSNLVFKKSKGMKYQTNTNTIVKYQSIKKLKKIQEQHFQFVGNPNMSLIFKSLRMFRLTFWSLSLKCFEIISKLMSSIAVLGENPSADLAWKISGHYSQSFPCLVE